MCVTLTGIAIRCTEVQPTKAKWLMLVTPSAIMMDLTDDLKKYHGVLELEKNFVISPVPEMASVPVSRLYV
jgi:hypothetical protein